MFERITIQLTGPICGCETQSLSWAVPNDSEGKETLAIWCNQCNVKLAIPHGSFKAGFSLKTSYPGKAASKPELKVLDGGKVVPFKLPDEPTILKLV